MSKACVRVATFLSVVCVGCGASQGGGSTDDSVFGGGGKGAGSGFGAGASGGAGYLPDMLMNRGASSGSGSSSGGGDDKFCKQQEFKLNRLPPEIMLVLDRSGSMQRNGAGKEGTPTKWSLTTAAIDTTLAGTEKGVLWGLNMYPAWKRAGDSACGTAGIAGVDPGLSQHAQIMSTITSNAPTIDKGATPTAKAMIEATALMKGRPSPNPKFILLATDGIPNCRNNSDGELDIEGATAAVAAANQAGFATFVVGIAAAGIKVDGVDTFKVLNDMAAAGGKARDGDTKFYPAANQQELASSLSSIAAQAADCTFVLSEPPSVPDNVAVELDGVRLSSNDWAYGAGNRSVVVKGAYCDKLKKGDIEKAQIKFGCAGQVIL